MLRNLSSFTLLLLTACKVFDPSLVEQDVGLDTTEPPDTGMIPDTTTRPDVPTVNDGCDGMGMTIPARPSGPDTGEGNDLILGLHNLLLNQDGERWRGIGRNLDGLCSNPPVPRVECQPRDDDHSPVTDGEGGIDNAFGGPFFMTVDIVAEELEETAVSANNEGTGVVVFRVRGWNGELDDPSVEVSMAQSVFGFAGTADQTEPPDFDVVDFQARQPGSTDRMPFPTWDGNDWMFPRVQNFYDGNIDTPRVINVNAYVSGGVLVSEIEDNVAFNFASTTQGISVKLTDTLLMMHVHESLEHYGRAELSGRWKVQELLQAARTVGICPGNLQFDILSNALDRIADVLSMPTDSNDLPCDALSVGVRWTFDPVRFGPTTEGALPPDQCDGMM